LKGGRINADQVEAIAGRFAQLPPSILRIVVTHHPFDIPEAGDESQLVGRATMAMRGFARAGVDLFLSGHLHQSHHSTTQRYAIEGHSALVVQSGTSTSTRGRGESNAFNVLRIEPDRITVETRTWQSARSVFELARSTVYSRRREGWSQEHPAP